MSSSSARRFLNAFALAFTLFAATILAVCWAVDPSGQLRTAGLAPALCAPGIPAMDERFAKPLMLRVRQPADVLVGSSRVGLGFSPQAFRGANAANLGLSAASFAEVDTVARAAAAEPSVRRIWLGMDFGILIQHAAQRPSIRDPGASLEPRWAAVRYGLFEQRAVRAAVLMLVSPRQCAHPAFNAAGFAARPADLNRSEELERRGREMMVRSFARDDASRFRLYSERLAELDRLFADLRRRQVKLVIFLSPTSARYRDVLAEAGLAPLYRRWRRDAARLARRHGATFVESDSDRFLAPIARQTCVASSVDRCLFLDTTHYRPAVGDAIVRAALAAERRPVP